MTEYADAVDNKYKYHHCDVNFNYIYKYLINGKKRKVVGANGFMFDGTDKPLHENDAYAAYLLKRQQMLNILGAQKVRLIRKGLTEIPIERCNG